jgi:NDP-sugar pyrophosphorylase family protein
MRKDRGGVSRQRTNPILSRVADDAATGDAPATGPAPVGFCLAAGAGTRLRPLTGQVPKPLLAPAGRPLVDLACEALDRAGTREIVVNTHHGASQLAGHLDGRPGLHVLHEPELLGTGGALGNAYHLGLLGGGTVLVTSADVLVHPADLASVAAQLDRGGEVAIGLVPARPGLLAVRLDGDATIPDPAGPWAPAGVHALRAGVLEPVPPRPASLVDVLLAPLWRRGEVAGVVLEHPWADAGTPHRFLAAAAGLLAGRWPYRLPPGQLRRTGPGGGPVFLAEGAAAHPTALLAGPVVLDKGSRVGAHAMVTRTVLAPGASIGDGAHVSGSILGPGATIPPGARVTAALIPGPTERSG